jgi:hypothetical protein
METLILVLVALTLLAVAAATFGADSRPADEARPTRWWPADRANN